MPVILLLLKVNRPITLMYPVTQNICLTFIQRRPDVYDVGITLYKCHTIQMFDMVELVDHAGQH